MGDMVRTVTEAKVERAGDMVLFTVSADGFLYNMVRIMVGTLLRVVQGKFQPEDIPHIWKQKQKNGWPYSAAVRIIFEPCILLIDRGNKDEKFEILRKVLHGNG